MALGASQAEEFIIPTRYKTQIGSYLSWPIGAMELTKSLLHVPQIKELQLKFYESYPKKPQGKWPVSFSVIEARYAYHRTEYAPIAGVNDANWYLNVYPVPRLMRAEIREALKQHGFRLLADWLIDHAKLSNREGNLNFKGVWNSESKELTFGSQDYVLPEVSSDKQRNKR